MNGGNSGEPRVTEAELQDAVIEVARLFGWRVAHFRPARTEHGWRTPVGADGKGFPDLVLARDRVLFVELKSTNGRVSPEQVQWAKTLRAAQGVQYHLWRPEDWMTGVIEEALRP